MVCADEAIGNAIAQSVGAQDLEIIGVGTGGEAMAIARQQYLDGIVIHQQVEDIGPLRLADDIHASVRPAAPPIILMTAGGMSSEEEVELARLTRAGVLKPFIPSNAYSMSRSFCCTGLKPT